MDSRVSKTRAHVKITAHEKRRHAAGREKKEAWFVVPHFSFTPPLSPFLARGDFLVCLRLACSTIPDEKWGLLVV